MATVWSQIGGFIGIFLGYSLLQIPELAATFFRWAKKMFTSYARKPIDPVRNLETAEKMFQLDKSKVDQDSSVLKDIQVKHTNNCHLVIKSSLKP